MLIDKIIKSEGQHCSESCSRTNKLNGSNCKKIYPKIRNFDNKLTFSPSENNQTKRHPENNPKNNHNSNLTLKSLTTNQSTNSGSERPRRESSSSESSIIDVSCLQRRELKWIEMLRNWPFWMSRHFDHIRSRCRKGIPPSLRGLAWRYLSGSIVLENLNPNMYSELVNSENADSDILSEIKRDLHRSLPKHDQFYSISSRSSLNVDYCKLNSTTFSDELNDNLNIESETNTQAKTDLFNVLKAFSLFNKKVGYCQALAPLTSVLLVHLPADQAFWVLVSICRFYMPNYYEPGLCQFHKDEKLFQYLLVKYHLTNKCSILQQTEPLLYMTEWFMCLFARSLPWASMLRVWDMFFCEGPKVLFSVALTWLTISIDGRDRLLKSSTATLLSSSANNNNGINDSNKTNNKNLKSSYQKTTKSSIFNKSRSMKQYKINDKPSIFSFFNDSQSSDCLVNNNNSVLLQQNNELTDDRQGNLLESIRTLSQSRLRPRKLLKHMYKFNMNKLSNLCQKYEAYDC